MGAEPHRQTVASRYEVEHEIGRGGMGIVYRARDLRTARHVALKVLSARLATEPKALRRFQREAASMSRLEHPNVVRVYDFGETEDGDQYLVMELVESPTLAQVMARDGRLAPERVAHIGLQVARALVAAHAEGVVHRDLKPSNLLVQDLYGEPDFVKVTDFGIAQLPEDTTHSGTVVGTPHYASPEQARGAAVDARSDLYSLGVVLYELASGERPFDASTVMGILYHQVHTPPPFLSAIAPEVPAWLERLVGALLEKEPDKRIQSAREVVERLREALGEGSASRHGASASDLTSSSKSFPPVDPADQATHDGVHTDPRVATRRHAALLPLAVATALVALAVGGVAVGLHSQPPVRAGSALPDSAGSRALVAPDSTAAPDPPVTPEPPPPERAGVAPSAAIPAARKSSEPVRRPAGGSSASTATSSIPEAVTSGAPAAPRPHVERLVSKRLTEQAP